MPVEDGGQESITHYKVLERFNGHTLVQLQLETGRTHQIRIHLSYIGYPIVGDHLYCYGDPFEYRRVNNIPDYVHNERVSEYIDRQALHARYLAFEHPVTRQWMEFETEIPEDIQKLIATVKNI